MGADSGEKGGASSAPSGEKKKKVKAGPPAPPAHVEAGHLVVKAALAKVFGLPLDAATTLQPVWVTEAGTAKVTMELGASRRSPFPKDASQHERLLDLVEREVKALTVGPLKRTADGRVVVGDEAIFRSPHAVAETVEVTLLRERDPKKKPDTTVLLAGKKKQVSVKFKVVVEDAVAAEATGEKIFALAEEVIVNEAAVLIAMREQYEANVLADVTAEEDTPKEKAAAGGAAPEEEEEEEEMVVDPFTVSGKIDYEKLITTFGSQRISEELLARMERLLLPGKKLHRFLRRGIFFSHRDVDKICEQLEKKRPFYLYTGRGPSSAAMHLGHLVPFMMTQWLQDAFGVPLVVQMTDDEKFLWKGKYDEATGDFDLDYYRQLTRENAKDIIACGFQKERTFIFSDCDYVGTLYPNILKIQKSVTYSQAKGAFGFDGASNIGQSAFPAVQAAPSFASSFPIPLANFYQSSSSSSLSGTRRGEELLGNAPCLIPCAIDQDPYFRVTRDVAHKLAPRSHPLSGKPALIHSKFFPPLSGALGKMSSSTAANGGTPAAIFLTDSPADIERTIKTHAFSGGRETAKLQREKGADLDKDVSFQWLTFFLDDDDELDNIKQQYGSGSGHYWNTAAVKAKLVAVLQDIVHQHQLRRNAIDDAQLDEWLQIRPLDPPEHRD